MEKEYEADKEREVCVGEEKEERGVCGQRERNREGRETG